MILGQKERSDLLLKSVSTKKIEPLRKSSILHEKFVGVNLIPTNFVGVIIIRVIKSIYNNYISMRIIYF